MRQVKPKCVELGTRHIIFPHLSRMMKMKQAVLLGGFSVFFLLVALARGSHRLEILWTLGTIFNESIKHEGKHNAMKYHCYW
jgi:hypothetical protein